jgi:hypothetical protein
VRVKAVKMDDYKADKGLQLDVNTSSVWQFLVSDGGSSFLEWLKPTKEYVKPRVENKVGLFALSQLLASGGSMEEQVEGEFQINSSVCAVGVSLDEFQFNSKHWLSLGVPLFVSVRSTSWGVEEIKAWLENTDLTQRVTYVLDLGLSYTEVNDLTAYLKAQKLSEEQVRLVGNCVFKYKGQNYCGLFSPSFAKSYKLDWVYDSEPHKATQVFLSKDSSREVPIEDCTYPKASRTGGI